MNKMPSAGLFSTLKLGQRYMKSWPKEKCLNAILPENRIMAATQFGQRFAPPIAVFILFWQFYFHAQWGPAIATAIFALSLPIQGLWWLGKRSYQPLPPATLTWYQTLKQQLGLKEATATTATTIETLPTYQNLADLINLALKKDPEMFYDSL